MQDNAKAILDAQKLEMEQSEILLKVADSQKTKQFKEQKAQADRLSKQQMKALEEQKVKLEQQKLQLKAMQDNAKAILDAQKLEMEQSEVLLKVADSQQTKQFKEQKAQADRLSKQQMKALEALVNMSLEDNKIESQEKMKSAELLTKLSQ